MSREELELLIIVMAHAILADGKIHDRERAMIQDFAKTIGIEINLPDDTSKLPILESILRDINNPILKVQILTLCMDTVTADGELNEAEKVFLAKLCELIGIDGDYINRYVKVAEIIAKGKEEFNSLIADIFGDYN